MLPHYGSPCWTRTQAKGYGRTLPPPRICLLAKHEHFASENAKFAPVPPFGRSRLLLHLNPNKKGNEKAHAGRRVPFRCARRTKLQLEDHFSKTPYCSSIHFAVSYIITSICLCINNCGSLSFGSISCPSNRLRLPVH